jgi:TolB-like protein/Tfp pilus assembly protein PilF
MSESVSKAVFLSYASQDADAVLRIAEALRAAGVEVWFDQDELVGGDAWDAKIRKQIAECALFVPVISANTQVRTEGYFRLEWKLAAHRTHKIADDAAFLLPVVIDETRDAEARVPTEFKAVQWTRLAVGEISDAFCARVKKLLGGGPAQASSPALRQNAGGTPALPQTAKRRVSVLVLSVALVVLAAAGGFLLSRKGVLSPAAVADKSIAVLPFENRSVDQTGNAVFADGIHEDILTNLAQIRELRVVSRTSVMQYRGTKKPIPQIARELGVAYLLEGSVQRDGNAVRVTGQLIRAATDGHVWAESYDRAMTNVFAIQSEIARAIATELKAALSPADVEIIGRRATNNPAAYDLFLRARAIESRTGADAPPQALREAIELLLKAVELDPGFARAWAELGKLHSILFSSYSDRSDARRAQAQTAIDTAMRLAPDLIDVRANVGLVHYAFRDFARATEQFRWITERYPNDARAWRYLGFIQRRLGNFAESLPLLQRSVALDPTDIEGMHNLARHLFWGRRFAEAEQVYRRLGELRPEELDHAFLPADLATLALDTRDSTAEGDAFFAQLPPAAANLPAMLARRMAWAQEKGDAAEFVRLEAQSTPDSMSIISAAVALAHLGDLASAREKLAPIAARLRAGPDRDPGNVLAWLGRAALEALYGEKEAAVRDTGKATELVPAATDSLAAGQVRFFAVGVLAWAGDKDAAFEELTRLVKIAPAISIFRLRRSWFYAPLRSDPRWAELLNDPKNNGPLF